MDQQFSYTLESSKSFDEVVANIEANTAKQMFRVLAVHDVQKTLAEKGLERNPLKIIEICNAKFAHEVLGKEIGLSLFMPCKINVYTENGNTKIKAMRPAAIAQFYPEIDVKEQVEVVDKIVIEIADRAAKGE